MKKILSLLLVLVTVLSLMSGITFAANAVEINLRPGRTVDAGTPAEFEKAYKELYEPGSTINRIRVTGNYNVYTKGLRTPGGHDPWVSGYENQLCVRMPEGTCLDLNGHILAVRSSQGLDDNGTGKPSGQKHFGTVIDTFGGGKLNLYCFNEVPNLQYALELARAHSDIVGIVSVSQATPDCENVEFTIPAGITLRFSGKPSHLPAKKVTLEPGATVEKVYDQSPGFKDCKAIVMQYVNDADKIREGCQYATEMVKVEGTVPVREFVNYKINVEGGDQTVKGKPAIHVTEPAVINSNSDATTEAAVITNPSGVTFEAPRKLSYAEIQKLIQDICVTFYYHALEHPYIQYDGLTVSKLVNQDMQRKWDKAPPEWAAMDNTVFSVCSDYCWMAYYTAFAQETMFKASGPRTRTWANLDPADYPGVVYHYAGPQATGSKGETNLAKAVAESRKIVQAGDIICYANNDGGHALMFVGDIFGDGTDYILHCRGDSYDKSTGRDILEEAGGCIELMKADETVWSADGVTWSLNRPDSVALGFVIMRPALDPDLPQLPTQTAMNRMKYPRIIITRELDRYKFTGVQTGEEVPVYVNVTNESTKEYTEVPVEEYIPEGTTLVEGSATKGVKIEGNTLKWAVKIPAGKSITLTYKVKVNAKLGETVEFKAGLVGGIPSRPTTLQVGGKPLTLEQQEAVHFHGLTLRDTKGSYQDLAFFNKFYAEALNIDPGLPRTTQQLLEKLTTAKDKTVFRAKTDALDKMIIPLHFAGQYADPSGGNWARVREFKAEYYEPGDIFVCLGGDSITGVKNSKDVDLMMYLGDGHVLVYTKDGVKLKTYATSLGYYLKYNLVIALRPSLAYEDINTRLPQKIAFTDVTEADWYYSYVEALVQDGVVSGMTATTFAPKGNLTYGQALKLIAVGLGYGEQAATADHWAGGYLALAQKEGWLTGNINLDGNISRIAFCRVAAKAKGLTAQPASNPFKDTSNASVLALVKAGVINGMTEDTFQPNGLLTRAQISKIIYLLRGV